MRSLSERKSNSKARLFNFQIDSIPANTMLLFMWLRDIVGGGRVHHA